ncbi:MAG TPA: DUF2905 domain-containing protein [Clostridia bacterium]|nr:DUF2905 domain-containing protein [Clostridia bacterium]
MSDFTALGKILIILGFFIVILGAFLLLAGRIPGIGRLPGDIYYQKGNFSFYFPVVTCLIISIVLSIILNFVFRR